MSGMSAETLFEMLELAESTWAEGDRDTAIALLLAVMREMRAQDLDDPAVNTQDRA